MGKAISNFLKDMAACFIVGAILWAVIILGYATFADPYSGHVHASRYSHF